MLAAAQGLQLRLLQFPGVIALVCSRGVKMTGAEATRTLDRRGMACPQPAPGG